jgi:hypothetical protein
VLRIALRELDDPLNRETRISALANPHFVEKIEIGEVDAPREKRRVVEAHSLQVSRRYGSELGAETKHEVAPRVAIDAVA